MNKTIRHEPARQGRGRMSVNGKKIAHLFQYQEGCPGAAFTPAATLSGDGAAHVSVAGTDLGIA